MGQVKGECVTTDVDIDSLAVLATMCCDPNAAFDESCLDGTDDVDDESIEVVEIPEMVEWAEATDSEGDADASEFVCAAEVIDTAVQEEFPVLSPDADAEIVEIFLEEADEEIVALNDAIPAWVNNSAA
jgi:hypothetical protein